MKYIRILTGPYHGQTLQLEDDVAESAIADEWGADTTAEGYDRFNEPPSGLGDANEYPASLRDYLDSISGVQTQDDEQRAKKPKATARAEPHGRLSDDAKTSPEPKGKADEDDEDDKSKHASSRPVTHSHSSSATKPATRK